MARRRQTDMVRLRIVIETALLPVSSAMKFDLPAWALR